MADAVSWNWVLISWRLTNDKSSVKLQQALPIVHKAASHVMAFEFGSVLHHGNHPCEVARGMNSGVKPEASRHFTADTDLSRHLEGTFPTRPELVKSISTLTQRI